MARTLPVNIRSGRFDLSGQVAGNETPIIDTLGQKAYRFHNTSKKLPLKIQIKGQASQVEVLPGNSVDIKTSKLISVRGPGVGSYDILTSNPSRSGTFAASGANPAVPIKIAVDLSGQQVYRFINALDTDLEVTHKNGDFIVKGKCSYDANVAGDVFVSAAVDVDLEGIYERVSDS